MLMQNSYFEQQWLKKPSLLWNPSPWGTLCVSTHEVCPRARVTKLQSAND